MEQQQQQEQDFSFNLNGKDYKYSERTDDEKVLVQQLNDIQNQLGELEFKHNQIQGSKEHFTSLLIKSVESADGKKTEETSAESSESAS
jgi:hypothetical protein